MPQAQHMIETMDRLYERIARRPGSVIASGALLGVALCIAVTAGKLPDATPVPAPTPSAGAAAQPAAAIEPLAVVGAYNAASIAAAASGDASLVEPFFAPGSREPDAIRAEFARRAARGERHRSNLVRWGVAEQLVHGGNASIVTQEVWDDQVFRGGEPIDARYGTILRIRYSLRRSNTDTPWRIQTIHSTVVVP